MDEECSGGSVKEELDKLQLLLHKTVSNVGLLVDEWSLLKKSFYLVPHSSHTTHEDCNCTTDVDGPVEADTICISKATFEKLMHDIGALLTQNLRSFLSIEVNQLLSDFRSSVAELSATRDHVKTVKQEKEQVSILLEKARQNCEASSSMQFELNCELQETQQLVTQQSDFCKQMGSTCGALLWAASKSDATIDAMLSTDKLQDFVQLVHCTFESFLHSYENDCPSVDSPEIQFVLSLCGTITNMAASPAGRHYLSTNESSRHLICAFTKMLSKFHALPLPQLKLLSIMFLYNISINQQGHQLLSTSCGGLLTTLGWILTNSNNQRQQPQHHQKTSTISLSLTDKADGSELKVLVLRLIQSLLYKQTNRGLILEAVESIPISLLKSFCSTNHPVPSSSATNAEVKELAVELASYFAAIRESI